MAGRGRVGNLIAWIAAFAILTGSLAPAISHALQRDAAAERMDICSSVGASSLAADDGDARRGAPAVPVDHLFQHCPYCALNADVLGMPPASASSSAAPALGFIEPEHVPATPRTRPAWTAQQPRAPPTLS